MKNALVITAYIENIEKLKERLENKNFDYIIAADGGYKKAKDLGLNPDYIIGDFDSSPLPQLETTKVLPKEKDFTDTEAALSMAIEEEPKTIYILGGLGGRFDHTLGNIALLNKFADYKGDIYLLDGTNKVQIKKPSSFKIYKENYTYISFFSYENLVENLSVKGVKYHIENKNVAFNTTLFTSNEILGDYCCVDFTRGNLLIIQSSDIDKEI